jgi:hypothetical protein
VKRTRVPYVSLFLCLLLTLVNIILTISSKHTSSTVAAPVTHKNIHLLRRPSQYIRFDEVRRPSPPIPRQFNNYPIAVAQVDSADKRRVFEEDLRAYMSPIGTVVPGDRRVLVTQTVSLLCLHTGLVSDAWQVSTIIQFITIDWGMEDCELHLFLPRVEAKSVSIGVYRLNQTYPLDLAALSYQSRPQRVAKVATIQLSTIEGTIWRRRFSCVSDEVLTFELACSQVNDGHCAFEWWQKQGHGEPNPGKRWYLRVRITTHARHRRILNAVRHDLVDIAVQRR